MHVRMFNPTSIAHAINLAKLHDSSQTLAKSATRFTSWKPSTSATKSTTPSQTPNPISDPIPTQKPIFNKTNRTLSNDEMADRRAKELCWFCDEPFSLGHHLKHRKNQLMILEMDEEEPLEPVHTETELTPTSETTPNHDTPLLSLHAMTGMSSNQNHACHLDVR